MLISICEVVASPTASWIACSRLGLVRHQEATKWVWYRHAASGTEILLADKKPDEPARPSEIVSTCVHLLAKGLISQEEIDSLLANGLSGKSKNRPKL